MGAGQGKALSPPWRPLQGGFYSPKLELKLKSLSQVISYRLTLFLILCVLESAHVSSISSGL
jgi:hypothetical protein